MQTKRPKTLLNIKDYPPESQQHFATLTFSHFLNARLTSGQNGKRVKKNKRPWDEVSFY